MDQKFRAGTRVCFMNQMKDIPPKLICKLVPIFFKTLREILGDSEFFRKKLKDFRCYYFVIVIIDNKDNQKNCEK